ncbi:efflux RND transporter periplasmic adaptor subunit [Pararhizobium antarcticum]|uniref:Efflux transporter periplasmic adaptor subunit n=1 Tax=Pararhizobium antarcticum TaxID=1798805 RepID=A0A657LVJ2_9HYPH|nr:efflux RND transporter periplasmic adaptor subunit [Pararhizobium antarcticum]OJF97813.1 efflux transporter periplasmic adaptor subunit [Rhizobium sp. 58]OJF98244.1 efflux transporter periplasmic adaptor subunit [Pararhizobium antarcticum]
MAFNAKFAAGVSASLMLLLMSSPGRAQEPAEPASEQNLPSIVVSEVRNNPIVERVLATGALQAVEETYVAPLVDGLSIRSLNADVGDTVKEGSTLVVLNNDMLLLTKSEGMANLAKANASLAQYKAQLAEATATADEAVRVATRSRQLATSGTVSTAQADQDEASATAARARVNSAEQMIAVANADIKVVEAQISDVALRLTRTEVKAPVSGVIAAKTAKVGSIASGAGEPLFTIIKDGAIEMKADVSESDLLKLAVGQKARITLADGNNPLDGTIRLISPKVDDQTRLGTVYVSLAQPEKARIGMYANAELIVTEKQAIVLPLTAVTTARNETTVRKVEDGVVRIVKVETGIQDGRFIEITAGLTAGDEVVAKAGAYVRDGDRINPVKPTTDATN